MSIVCALSGKVPENPVVTPEGVIYERRLIEECLRRDKKCPITGNSLSIDSLIQVQSPLVAKPISPEIANIDTALKTLQTAFDGLVLNLFSVTKERDESRSQVATYLYEKDASTKTVASLLQKVDELTKQLAEAQQITESSSSTAKRRRTEDEEMTEYTPESIPSTVPAETVTTFAELSKTLMSGRKKRAIPHRSDDEISKFTVSPKFNPIKSEMSESIKPTCFDVLLSQPKDKRAPSLVLVGVDDGQVSVFDIHQDKTVGSINAHEGAVNDIRGIVHPSLSHYTATTLGLLGGSSSSSAPFPSPLNFLTAGADGFVKFWKSVEYQCLDDMPFISNSGQEGPFTSGDIPESVSFIQHGGFDAGLGAVSSLALHPRGTHFGSSFLQEPCFLLWDMTRLTPVYSQILTLAAKKVQFHPDGILAACLLGNCSNIAMIDTRTSSVRVELSSPDVKSHVTCMSFSENGYYFVSGHYGGDIVLWDLRSASAMHTTRIGEAINSCAIDYSGQHMVFAGNDSLSAFSFSGRSAIKKCCSFDQGGVKSISFCPMSDDYIVGMLESGEILYWN